MQTDSSNVRTESTPSTPKGGAFRLNLWDYLFLAVGTLITAVVVYCSAANYLDGAANRNAMGFGVVVVVMGVFVAWLCLMVFGIARLLTIRADARKWIVWHSAFADHSGRCKEMDCLA